MDYRVRYYSPQLRRFIEPDPVDFEGGMNLYAYVGNDPANAVDPWGLFRSPESMRYIVPGQVSFDYGWTEWQNGNYGVASLYFASMLGEQVLFALSFGQSSAAKGASTGTCEITASKNLSATRGVYLERVEQLGNQAPKMLSSGASSESVAREMVAARNALNSKLGLEVDGFNANMQT